TRLLSTIPKISFYNLFELANAKNHNKKLNTQLFKLKFSFFLKTTLKYCCPYDNLFNYCVYNLFQQNSE
ncbi:MAG TPA: hypothetical protein DCS66_09800, partial [Flavobacteriaceae bacterium]|nr:hypothetical protein [Flavobacteriaceae bacterium]